MIQIKENKEFIIKGVPTIIYKLMYGTLFGKWVETNSIPKWRELSPLILERFQSGEYEIEYCSDGCGSNNRV